MMPDSSDFRSACAARGLPDPRAEGHWYVMLGTEPLRGPYRLFETAAAVKAELAGDDDLRIERRPEIVARLDALAGQCACHEWDGCYVCDHCYALGFRGHMQK